MYSLLATAFVLALTLASTDSVPQEITFYTELGFEGDAVTIRSHWSEFGCDRILRNSQSFCVTGFWIVATEENFEGRGILYGQSESRRCGNSPTIQAHNSIRYLAAADTATPAITFYGGIDYMGTQIHILGVAAHNFHFEPKSYATSGRTSWTFFTGPNFDGNSACIQAGSENVTTQWRYTDVVLSAVRGCGKLAEDNVREFLKASAMGTK